MTNAMESVLSCEWTRKGILTVVGIGILFAANKLLQKHKKSKLRAKWNAAGKDVVVLHQFWKGKLCPNMSPYVLKVECFLRLAGIKYIVDMEEPFGGKRGLCPWITLNGEEIEDSQHIVEHLSEQFNVKLDDHLSPERRAALEAVRIMLEEQMFWILFMWRYYHTKCKTFGKTQTYRKLYLKYFFPWIVYRHSQKRGRAHGIARHTLSEQLAMGKKQIVILDTLLGDGQYFGGDKPCTVDCIAFGFLIQFMFNDTDSPFETLIKETYPRLEKYCLRMKEYVYPDWNKLLDPPQE